MSKFSKSIEDNSDTAIILVVLGIVAGTIFGIIKLLTRIFTRS